MNINKGHIYHLCNSGNNAQPIFFDRSSYLIFLEKMHIYLLPYVDVLSWCLLPTQFHLMVYVKETEIEIEGDGLCNYRKRRNLANSVSIMLCAYIRTMRKKITGNFFQHSTEAVCLTDATYAIPAWYLMEYGSVHSKDNTEKEYPQLCFRYIHNAPIKEGLVKKKEDWEFSSYPDVTGSRKGRLINRERIREFGLFQAAINYSYL